jgi:Tfp pilus assembly protein FimT
LSAATEDEVIDGLDLASAAGRLENVHEVTVAEAAAGRFSIQVNPPAQHSWCLAASEWQMGSCWTCSA